MTPSELEEALRLSPYSFDGAGLHALCVELTALHERVELLRSSGRLSQAALQRYFGQTRFQQVAESNAIEGSTLDVGETELAVLKGVTVTGHDEGFVRDAVALNNAIVRVAELARSAGPTDITEVKEIHELIFAGRAGAGQFRSVPVRITGSEHRPPKTWGEVMSAMESWERWSKASVSAPPLLRAAVLHAWFAHIHPFLDGNGRTARAIGTLELVRAGYPAIIFRKTQDRDRYISALRRSDDGGNLGEFTSLTIDRFRGALLALERIAGEIDGYTPEVMRLRRAQASRAEIWNRSIALLIANLDLRLQQLIGDTGGELIIRPYRDALTLDDYLDLCEGNPVAHAWSFSVYFRVAGLGPVERLAWIGLRTTKLKSRVSGAGPSIFWSKPNPAQFPPWVLAGDSSPGASEMTIDPDRGDKWYILDADGTLLEESTSTLAERLARGFVHLAAT